MNFIKLEDNISFSYCVLPRKILYEEPYRSKLSDKAKLVYMVILDRLKLSIKNRFVNEKNEIFVYLSRKEVQELFNYSDKTATKVFNELTSLNLIYEERTFIGKSIKIFVNKKDDIFIPFGKFTVINRKKYGCTVGNFTNRR